MTAIKVHSKQWFPKYTTQVLAPLGGASILGSSCHAEKGTNLSLVNKWTDVEPGKASFDHRSLMNTVVKREGNRPIMMIGPKVPPVQVQ